LCEFDDRAVRATDVLASATLRTQTRDHLDDQVDLVRQQRIEIDKAVTGKLGQLDVDSEPRVFREPASVHVKEVV
jgi:hypothetical protein